jgi:hypothetical protein
LQKRKGRFSFLLQNDLTTIYLFSVDLKEAHRENSHDTSNHQTDEEG